MFLKTKCFCLKFKKFNFLYVWFVPVWIGTHDTVYHSGTSFTWRFNVEPKIRYRYLAYLISHIRPTEHPVPYPAKSLSVSSASLIIVTMIQVLETPCFSAKATVWELRDQVDKARHGQGFGPVKQFQGIVQLIKFKNGNLAPVMILCRLYSLTWIRRMWVEWMGGSGWSAMWSGTETIRNLSDVHNSSH
jgi:hypothetical protein